MNLRRPRLAARALLLVAVLVSCTGPGSRSDQIPYDSGSVVQCAGVLAPITTSVRQLSNSEACALARTALDAFRQDSTIRRVLPSDTAVVARIRIGAASERLLAESRATHWWVITLDLPGQQRNVDVRVGLNDQRLEIWAVHKPLN